MGPLLQPGWAEYVSRRRALRKLSAAAAAAAKSLQSCDSVRPHRGQPTRLPHPWDSPGKKIGVGCHFLLQCMKVKSESEVAQLCLTLSDPMDCSLPGSSIHGIFCPWDFPGKSTRVGCHCLLRESFLGRYNSSVLSRRQMCAGKIKATSMKDENNYSQNKGTRLSISCTWT